MNPLQRIGVVINAERLVTLYLQANPPHNGNPRLTE